MRRAKIRNEKYLFISDKILKNIVRLDIAVHVSLRVEILKTFAFLLYDASQLVLDRFCTSTHGHLQVQFAE